MQEKIYEILTEQDDVTWKSILYDLVKSENMNPWDIDLTVLTKRFISLVKNSQETDLKFSGKMFLAAAILLKIKSAYLIDHDISKLNQLIDDMEKDEDWDEGEDDFYNTTPTKNKQKYTLIPKNPQPRSRKMSIHDLVEALQRAMDTKKRVLQKKKPLKFVMPERKMDIMDLIREVYNKINYYSKKEKKKKLTFSKLLPPRAKKVDKVYTFIPMLHLENEDKISIKQKKAFDEIYVSIKK